MNPQSIRAAGALDVLLVHVTPSLETILQYSKNKNLPRFGDKDFACGGELCGNRILWVAVAAFIEDQEILDA
uniref:hypothetical protein n=1 Tax=Pseudomonas sp. RW407 TaxID=2202894 RepID=UPI0011B850A9|nr:hypothetical protein [Pseudomonas sp. RW407]